MVPFWRSSTATVAAGLFSDENRSWSDSGLINAAPTCQLICEVSPASLFINLIVKLVEPAAK